jgi:hypothetical protein
MGLDNMQLLRTASRRLLFLTVRRLYHLFGSFFWIDYPLGEWFHRNWILGSGFIGIGYWLCESVVETKQRYIFLCIAHLLQRFGTISLNGWDSKWSFLRIYSFFSFMFVALISQKPFGKVCFWSGMRLCGLFGESGIKGVFLVFLCFGG